MSIFEPVVWPQLESFIAAACLVVYGLLAGWLVAGRLQIFYRVLATTVLIALPLRVGATELFVVHSVQVLTCALVFLCLRFLARWTRARRPSVEEIAPRSLRPKQFSMRDGFLIVLTFAVLVDSARRGAWIQPESRWIAAEFGLAAALVSILSLAVPPLHAIAWIWIIGTMSICAAIGKLLYWLLELDDPTRFMNPNSAPPCFAHNWTWIFPGVGLLTMVVWQQAKRAGVVDCRNLSQISLTLPQQRRARRFAHGALGVILLIVTPFFIELSIPLPFIMQSLPEDNAFDDLIKATKSLDESAVKVADWDTATTSQLQTFMASNQGLIDKIRGSFQKPLVIPVVYGDESYDFPGTDLRETMRALQLYARWLDAQSMPDAAANCRIDVIDFGRKISRDGLLIDLLVGIAVQRSGAEGLWKQVQTAVPKNTSEHIRRLERINRQDTNFANIVTNDREWTIRSDSWWNRFSTSCGLISGRDEAHMCRRAILDNQCYIQVLLAELAIRQFQKHRGRLPNSLEELVPDFLSSVPRDFHSNAPLVYRKDGDTFLVYSIGADLTDQGGKPIDLMDYEGPSDLIFTLQPPP